MQYINTTFVLLLFVINSYGQELDKDQIYLADPTIFEENGTYYLYGTKGDNRLEGEGFLVYTSGDLKNWNGPVGVQKGYALKKGGAFGTKGFWAPQVFKHNSKYYMAYTADEKIAIASSDSPLGPFINDKKALDAPVRQIDPFIFFDNGKPYLYHVRLRGGNTIFVAEMTENLEAIKPETLIECINAQKGWEDTQNVEWPVAEGPTVFKKDELYFLLYSANDFRNPDYAVGFASSSSPLGPWKRINGNPIISRENTGENGSGHGDLFTSKDGDIYYVFHTHNSKTTVHPRKTALIKLEINSPKIQVENHSFRWLVL